MRETAHTLEVARRFLPDLRPHARALLVVSLASVVVIGFELLRPWPFKWIIDMVLVPLGENGEPAMHVIWIGAGVAVLIGLGRAAVEYFRRVRIAIVGHQVTRSLRFRIFEHLTDLSPLYHARHKAGDLLMRLMGDVPMLRTMLVDSGVELISRLLLVVGMITVMLATDAFLTIVSIALIPLLFVVIRLLSQKITSAVRKQRKKEGVLADFLHEAVANTAVIQSLGHSRETVRRFARSNRSSARAGLKATRLAAGLSASVESMLVLCLATTLGLGSYRVVTTDLSVGELTVFLSYVRGMLKPLRAAARHSERIAKGTACGDRVLQVLDQTPEITSAPGAPAAPLHPHELALDGVRFGYGGDLPALDKLTTSFRRGELVGLFGESGAGKSTCAVLALRLHDPDQGAVRLDGIDVRSLDVQSLRDRFGLCMQETVLFGDTIRENLLLGRPDATDEQLWEVLEECAAAELVREQPDGLDARLGSLGAGLSGGQRHRISLARTLLRRAPVLILDEPFSGLDRATVAHIRATLERRAGDAIVIVVTHEPEHLEGFERIVFIDRGRVVAEGRHAELTQRSERYREVLGIQHEART